MSVAREDRAMPPFASAEQFLAAVHDGYEGLSRQLKVIARHVEKSREQIALDGIQETARQCEVQPSAVVRFAKHFGFSGYSEMQALFRSSAAQQLAPNRDYHARIRDLVQSDSGSMSAALIAHQVIHGSIDSLQALERGLSDERFDEAVALMLDAPTLWLAASRRSFPVGAYLAYALQHTAKPVHWLSGLGHMHLGQLHALAEGDVLVAVSFEPYANETQEVVRAAQQRGARVLAITDSKLSPIAANAAVTLLVQDAATFGFRSLTSTLCLAQSLFLGLAYRMELAYGKQPAAPTGGQATT